MFSKEESRKLREEFWISFGKSFPRKWILYKTQIKGLSLRFFFDLKKAIVAIDVDADLDQRINLWERLNSLKTVLQTDYNADAIFKDTYILENEKEISRIYIQLENVSIHNKNSWRETMEFLNKNMIQFENFFLEYQDILNS